MIQVALIDAVGPGALERLVARLVTTFHTEVSVYTPPVDVRAAMDVRRGQYNSTTLLAELLKHVSPVGDTRLVAVTDLDLFVPILTFVFGEAQLDGRVAIISTHRLRQAFYGLPDDPELLLERLEKEAVHELGHTFGLLHCSDYECVMHSSTSVEGVDIKGAQLCADCQAQVQRTDVNTRFHP